MKIFKFLFPVFFLPCLCFAQQTWNNSYGIDVALITTARSQGDHFLLTIGQKIIEIDAYGQMVALRSQNNTANPAFLLSPLGGTGTQSFIMATRGVSTSGGYAFKLWDPVNGDQFATSYTETLGSIPSGSPAWVEFPDHSFVVLGKTMARKIRYQDAAGFVTDWEKPIALGTPVAALLLNDQYYVITSEGGFFVCDSDFNVLVSKTFDFTLRSISSCPAGFVISGSQGGTDDNSGRLLRVDTQGETIWQKNMPFRTIRDAVYSNAGGFAFTGDIKPNTQNFLKLATCDDDGNITSEKLLSIGIGNKIIPHADGGLNVFAYSSAYGTRAIKTDAVGNTPEKIRKIEITGARLDRGNTIAGIGSQSESPAAPSALTTFATVDSIEFPVIYDTELWLTGIDQSQQVRNTIGLYSNMNFSPFQFGLLDNPLGLYERVWNMSREEVQAMRRDFLDNGTVDITPPYHLLTWPGRGNPNYRYDGSFYGINVDPDQLVAPFVDYNGDGTYNVYDGDYPIIKGDNYAWLVFNDGVVFNNETGIGVEVMGEFYTYDCAAGTLPDNTILAEFTIINRSDNTYSNFRTGMFSDIDLGCLNDDYFGTIPDASAYYSYNADAVDQPCQTEGNFDVDIPVQSGYMLGQSLDKIMGYTSAFSQVPPAMYRPQTPAEIHQFMNGYWLDGTPLTEGGTGYNPGGGTPANFLYSGNPADVDEWSQCTNNGVYQEINFVTSTPGSTFAPGDTLHYRTAFTLHPNIPHPCPDIDTDVQSGIQQMQNWYTAGTLEQRPNLPLVAQIPASGSLNLDASIPGASSYLWSNGATTPAITVSSTGIYTVVISRETGCDLVEEVHVLTSVGTQQPGQPIQWSIQPNPARDRVLVQWNNPSGNTLRVRVLNAWGQVVDETEQAMSMTQFSAAALAPGFYQVELWENERRAGVQKLLIVR